LGAKGKAALIGIFYVTKYRTQTSIHSIPGTGSPGAQQISSGLACSTGRLRQGFGGSHALLAEALRQCHRLARNARLAGRDGGFNIRRRCPWRDAPKAPFGLWRTAPDPTISGLEPINSKRRHTTHNTTSSAPKGRATGCAGQAFTKPAFTFTKSLKGASSRAGYGACAGALGNTRPHTSSAGHIGRTSSGRSATSGGRCQTSRNSCGNGARYFKSPSANRVLLTVQGKIGALLFEGGFVWGATKHRTQGSGGFF
jgi:hypothetical protein